MKKLKSLLKQNNITSADIFIVMKYRTELVRAGKYEPGIFTDYTTYHLERKNESLELLSRNYHFRVRRCVGCLSHI